MDKRQGKTAETNELIKNRKQNALGKKIERRRRNVDASK